MKRDIAVLRELAWRYAEVCAKPVQDERRDLWRRHNSRERTRPLVYVRWFAARKEIIDPHLCCEDPFYREHEATLRHHLFQDEIGDDYVLEPWLTQQAVRITPCEGLWGVKFGRTPRTEERGSWMFDPPIKEIGDLSMLVVPRHEIDEEATWRNVARLHEAVGDIIEINVDRSPAWNGWDADISTDLARLRGLEQMMWDMTDNPEWLHRLLGFMRDGVLKAQAEAEAAGDWRLANSENQAMPYSKELADPKANSEPVSRKQLWGFFASQETTLVSPAMFDEFILRYQMPIMENFGLVAYGCCEDLTRKIGCLRKVPNLRRIAATPWADIAKCAEQIGTDYVMSWRPSPAEHVCAGFDPEHVRRAIRAGLDAAKGCHVDITLKDVETVEGDPQRLVRWTRIVREAIDEVA